MNTRNLKKNVPPYIRSTFSGTPAARQFIYQWDCPHFVRPSVLLKFLVLFLSYNMCIVSGKSCPKNQKPI